MKRFCLSSLLFLSFVSACSDDDASTATTPTGTDGGGGGTDGGTTSDSSFPDGNTGEVLPPRRVFLTGARRTGANGGTAGADALCAAEATTAKLDGTFIAWLSTPTQNAVDRLTKDAAFMNVGGGILWDSRAEIEAGSGPKVGITRDAFGKEVTGVSFVWTGTNANGKPATDNCNEWTTNVPQAMGSVGAFGSTGKEWTADAASKDCGQTLPLVCFEK